MRIWIACGPSAGSDRSRTPRSRRNCAGLRQETRLGTVTPRSSEPAGGTSSRPGVRLSKRGLSDAAHAFWRPALGREAGKSPCQHASHKYQASAPETARPMTISRLGHGLSARTGFQSADTSRAHRMTCNCAANESTTEPPSPPISVAIRALSPVQGRLRNVSETIEQWLACRIRACRHR